MQTLATALKTQNRTLRQLKRTGLIAIYDVRNEGQMLYGFEVVKIKVAPEAEIFGKQYPERELYPSSAKESADWGTVAWSFGTTQKRQALAMFNGLVKNSSKPARHSPATQLDDQGSG
jgi:hypothetical protein